MPARAMARKNRNMVGPDAEEEGLGFPVGPIQVVAGSLVFIAVVIVAHFASKLFA